MRKFVRISSLVLLFMAWMGGAEAQRECASHEHFEQMLAADPQFVINQQKLEQATREFIARGGAGAMEMTQAGEPVFRIPVVFHVIYNTSSQNISNQRLLAQLQVINEDFQKLNVDWTKTPAVYQDRVADVKIEFCLAVRDPQGNSTTGILRRQTTVTSFSTNNAMKYTAQGGSDAWPRDSYLNFWVCTMGGGILGYAQFPGGAAATDGVVCDYRSVGSTSTPGEYGNNYGLGRTATHEIGHWLNLRHIWGDGRCASDFVDDTPFHPGSNGGCPSSTLTTSCSQNRNATMMWMNYMDYTYDRCMYMFTNGQKNRMYAAMNGSRASLINSLGCVEPEGETTCAVPGNLSSSIVSQTGATLNWGAVSGAVNYTAQYRTPVGSGTWTQTNSNGTSTAIIGLTAGTTYEWQVRTNCSSSNSAFSASAQFTTQQPTVNCNPPTELGATNVTVSAATLSWANGTGAISSRLEYKTNSATTWTVVNPATSPYTVSGLSASTIYNWRVLSNCDGATSTYANGPNFTTSADPDACTDAYEPNNTSGTAASIPLNTTISAKICSADDVDWYTFSNNNQNRSVRVTLNVPAGVNYDMRLYRPNGNLARTTSGTASTKILTFTGNPTGAYRIEVFSTSDFSTTDTYNLLAEIGTFREDGSRMIVMGSQVRLFPNPASSELLLEFGSEWSGKADVSMTDILGRRVQRNIVNAVGTVSLDVSALRMGIYLVQVTNGEIMQTQKVMIRR